jgi:3'-phosphoadenosine 5'-phosphosulfate sulfotransferase (PAPS reductase)/FAD synthetase
MIDYHDIEAIKEKIGDRKIVVSVSGGKDSTAACLYMKELGLEYEAIFFDTGWEHPETYKYIEEYLPSVVGPISRLVQKREMRSPELEELAQKYEERIGWYSPMIRWVIFKGMFPSRVRRYCTQNLKVFPARDYLKSMDDEPINVVGIRAQESASRANMDEWEWSDTFDCEVWRPLHQWKVEDVIEIHQKYGVRPNPLYLGENPSERVGCYPCIFARKGEIRVMAANFPERIELLADLERDIEKLARDRYEIKKQKGETKPFNSPTWFQNPTSRKDPETGKRSGDTWPIHRVVQWSRTRWGGKQFELFAAPPGEQGCVRWGMCDTHGEPKE